MAKAKVTLTCTCCGKTFAHEKKCYNRRDADSYEEWAKENIDTCPDCYRAEMLAAEEKRIAYAKKLRSAERDNKCHLLSVGNGNLGYP